MAIEKLTWDTKSRDTNLLNSRANDLIGAVDRVYLKSWAFGFKCQGGQLEFESEEVVEKIMTIFGMQVGVETMTIYMGMGRMARRVRPVS